MIDLSENGVKVVANVVSTILATGTLSVFSWLILKSRFNSKFRQATRHFHIAEALQKERQYPQARDELVKTVELLGDERREILLGQAYLKLSDVSMSLKEWDKAIQYLILGREISKRSRHAAAEDVILQKLGKAYFASGKIEDALRCFEDARRIEEGILDHPLLGETYARLGEVEARRQHSEMAISYYNRALNCHEKIGDRRSVAASRVCLGDLNLQIEHPEQALSQYSSAREEFHELGDFPFVAMLDAKIAQIKNGAQPA